MSKRPSWGRGGGASWNGDPWEIFNGMSGTSKGSFTFQMVADGCYIEHKWGQNSGHVGVPLEAMPGFIEKMRTLYTKATVRANCLLAPASPFALPLLFLYRSRASSVFLLLFFLMLLLLLPLCGV